MADGDEVSVAGPLSGITVIDLSRILAGPFCTLVLAQLGARVIKVEPPGTGDDSRQYGPFLDGKSTYFLSVNHGKESIALDLKAPADRRIFEALLETADVLVENYRPGTMERLGYGWDSLHARYPRLIYAAASGFGHSGPYSSHPAYDMVVQALGGIMSVTGHAGQAPVRVGTSFGDLGAALFAAVGVNAALLDRERTGAARKIDIAMFDCQLALLENAVVRYTATGRVPGPLGMRHPSITPFEGFATADGWMVVAAGNDGLFRKLCETIGRTDLVTDARFVSNDLRTRNVDALHDELQTIFRSRPTAFWIGCLEEAGVPCGKVNNIAEALDHPQTAARNMLVEVETPGAAPLRIPGNPIKISGFADPRKRKPAPDLDGDRAALLRELKL